MANSQEVTVSYTARAMAAVRACESKRDDALFIDPFAHKLAGNDVVEKAITLTDNYEKQGRPYGQVRTRFLDDFLLKNLGNSRQVVLLGAGLDTRAYRLKLPDDLCFYEVDQEDVIVYKNQILANEQPRCDRRSIVADLGTSEWVDLLRDAGFKPEEPTIWILEGFIYYLMEDQATSLMAKIDELSAKESWLGCDLINNAVCNGSDDWASMWQFGCDVPEEFFARYGWQTKTVVQPSDPEACFGRFTFQLPPREDQDGIHIFFVTAVKVG